MLILGPIGFATPWLLAAGLALPVLWLVLRAAPPMPRRLRFPGVALLAGLADPAPRAVRTPWWLLALRMLALAALILGLAGPVWRPDPGGGLVAGYADAVLVVVDAGWAAAPDWPNRQSRAAQAIAAAGARPVALLLADGTASGPLTFGPGAEALARLRAARPRAWPSALPDAPQAALDLVPEEGRLASIWLSDALDHPHRGPWAEALAARGRLVILPPEAPIRSLSLTGERLPMLLLSQLGEGAPPAILAIGPDPQGAERVLARLTPGAPRAGQGVGVVDYPVPLDLPGELRNRVARFALEGVASAGAVLLADARTRRPKLALAGLDRAEEGQQLLDPAHYLRRAVSPFADLVEGSPRDVLQSAPDMVLLVDEVLPEGETLLSDWVRQGGTLLRFAGPRMAGDAGLAGDPLLPVRLRPGGRETGGALSWGQPRDLAPWPEGSPLSGLPQPPVNVRAQLVAEPGPEIAARSLARLSDATPLVTRARLGEGQVILFHVAADPLWSDLPLTGLFMQMIERLSETARRPDRPDPAPAEGTETLWRAQVVLDGHGTPGPAPDTAEPVAGEALDTGPAPGLPAGLYAAEERVRALNAGQAPLRAADWGGLPVLDPSREGARALDGWLLALAGLILTADVLASATLSGRMRRAGAV